MHFIWQKGQEKTEFTHLNELFLLAYKEEEKIMKKLLCIEFLFIILSLSSYSQEEKKIALKEALKIAVEKSYELKISESEIEANKYSSKSMSANFYPKLHTEVNMQYWGTPLKAKLMESEIEIDISQIPPPFDKMAKMFGEPIKVRDALTGVVSVSIIQPLTPIYGLYHSVAALDRVTDGAIEKKMRIKNDVSFRVIETYFKFLQVKKGLELSSNSVKLIKEHLERAKSFLSAGIIEKNDVLKAEVALANAMDIEFRAKAGVEVARSAFNLSMGFSPEGDYIPEDILEEGLPTLDKSLEEYEKIALEIRPEIKEAKIQVEIAECYSKTAWSGMIPVLSVMGTFTRSEGQTFSYGNQYFIGATLSWDIFEWGAKYYKIKEANMRISQAQTYLWKLKDIIKLEVKSKYLEAKQALDTLETTKLTIAQAEENFRLEKNRFEAHINTSVEVLDAETLLHQAKVNRINAYYNYLISFAGLNKATGRAPAFGLFGNQ